MYLILLLESDRPPIRYIPVGEMREWGGFSEWNVRELKKNVAHDTGVPIEDQLLFHRHLTITQAYQTKPLEDEVQLKKLYKGGRNLLLTMIFKSDVLSSALLEKILPHMSSAHRKELLIQLHAIPENELDVKSIHEAPVEPTAASQMISIRNHTTHTLVTHIIIDGEEYVPHRVDEITKMVQFRNKYPYQYSIASKEYAKEMKAIIEKYEVDQAHCEKLLHELPIALEKSQQKLVEDTDAVCEKMTGMELSDLGALVVEQRMINKEIKRQQERLSQLKPLEIDKSKFIAHEFGSEIHLPFGWHKFDETIYELTQKPPDSVISSLLQPNLHPVRVTRTRLQFEQFERTAN